VLVLSLALNLVRRQFGSDLLAGISIVAAVLLEEYLAGAFVVLMLSGGQVLEAFAVVRASSVLQALARRMPSSHIAAHDRDELGLTKELAARPLQAALASAAAFAVGAGVPAVTILVTPTGTLVPVVAVVSLLCLIALVSIALELAGRPCWSAPRGPSGESWRCSRRPQLVGCSALQSDKPAHVECQAANQVDGSPTAARLHALSGCSELRP